MSRAAVSLILIGTLLLGQSFCCCTLRAFSSTTLEAADLCCCNGPADTSKECPHSPGNQGHHCPCKKNKLVNGEPSKLVVLLRAFSEGWYLQHAHATLSMESSVVCCDIEHSAHSRSTSFPNLDGMGILRAVCSLRC